jgi:hypothetical protein
MFGSLASEVGQAVLSRTKQGLVGTWQDTWHIRERGGICAFLPAVFVIFSRFAASDRRLIHGPNKSEHDFGFKGSSLGDLKLRRLGPLD